QVPNLLPRDIGRGLAVRAKRFTPTPRITPVRYFTCARCRRPRRRRAGLASTQCVGSSGRLRGNPVKQLIAPASTFRRVVSIDGRLEVRNNYGCWPATTPDLPLSRDLLWVRLPLGAR